MQVDESAMSKIKQPDHPANEPGIARADTPAKALAGYKLEAEKILERLRQFGSNAQDYTSEDGETEHGILLDAAACEKLLWWGERAGKYARRGRPRRRGWHTASLFPNRYQEEFELERQKIIQARGGKARGAIKEAIAILAKRHRVEFDAMRKRIKGK
jgi:hypothetical protein